MRRLPGFIFEWKEAIKLKIEDLGLKSTKFEEMRVIARAKSR
jgi:hypothetical protein